MLPSHVPPKPTGLLFRPKLTKTLADLIFVLLFFIDGRSSCNCRARHSALYSPALLLGTEWLLLLRGSWSVTKIQASVGNAHLGMALRCSWEPPCSLFQKWAYRNGTPCGRGSLTPMECGQPLKPCDSWVIPPCGWEMALAPHLAFGFADVNL